MRRQEGRAVHGRAQGVEAALVGQGELSVCAPVVRRKWQPRGILHPWIGNVWNTDSS